MFRLILLFLFNKPILKIESADYYAVDHTPTYLWESASRSISAALIVYLQTILNGRNSWLQDDTIRRAIVIDSGVIQNPEILSFQRRQSKYPHKVLDPS